jgi:hypothetical protein
LGELHLHRRGWPHAPLANNLHPVLRGGPANEYTGDGGEQPLPRRLQRVLIQFTSPITSRTSLVDGTGSALASFLLGNAIDHLLTSPQQTPVLESAGSLPSTCRRGASCGSIPHHRSDKREGRHSLSANPRCALRV